MSLSSFCVVTNALRLNLFDLHSAKRDKKAKDEMEVRELLSFLGQGECGDACPVIDEGDDKEDELMTKTLKVDGMMCEHCEARVKKTLEAIEGVEEATADRTSRTAVMKLSKDIPLEVFKEAVEAQGYDVRGFE